MKLITLLTLSTALLVGASFYDDVSKSASWSKRLQARKADVIGRLHDHRSLRPRQSPGTCNTVRNKEGQCCTYAALDSSMECCSKEHVYNSPCSGFACCNNGQTYGTGNSDGLPTNCCVSPGVVFTNDQDLKVCCPTGVVVGTQCCLEGEHVEGDQCVKDAIDFVPIRRSDKSASSMVRRTPQHTRMLLSADLVAEHLVNNGKFQHNGKEYVDLHHQAHNDGILRRIAGKGMTKALKYVFRPGAVYDAERWGAVDFVPISEAYEFAVSDVPEIYARIVARPDFDTFYWQGASFDRDILYQMASGHPGYNETLVELYK